jgi:hypothetical protein
MVDRSPPDGDTALRTKLLLTTLLASAMFTGSAFADDWNVTRLRGEVMQLVDGEWLPLNRADIVPDDRRIKTTNNGHVTLVRGNETLELGPSTQVRIIDQGGAKPYTTVLQSWGTVAVEAEVRQVEHFAVQNQYLAAVVKGTRFEVSAKSSGASVDVERGRVSVGDAEASTVVTAGQRVSVAHDGTLKVSGKGVLPPVVRRGDEGGSREKDIASTVAGAVANLEQAKAAGDAEAITAAQAALQDAAAEAVRLAEVAVKGDDKEAAKAAADAAKAAEKAAKDAEKAAEKAAKDEAKADQDAAKAAAKAAEDARKAAEKAAKDQAKADEEAAKAAAKAAEEARKAAEKAAQEAEKAAHDDGKSDSSGKGGGAGDNSGKGKGPQ